jgi:hypothetical protein
LFLRKQNQTKQREITSVPSICADVYLRNIQEKKTGRQNRIEERTGQKF